MGTHIRERDIIHENGKAWVFKDSKSYVVMVDGATHATSDSAYALTDDGLNIAKARCDYLGRKMEGK